MLFLTLYPEPAASPRYRVLQFLPYLRDQGVECTVAPALNAGEYDRYSRLAREGHAFRYHAAEFMHRVSQILRARQHDIVFVQKAILSVYVKRLATLLHWRARRVVYDIDDAVNVAAPNTLNGLWKGMEEPGQINKVMARATLVLAGNRWLQSVAEAAGTRAEIFPTVVDTARFMPAAAPPEGFTVGWIGSPSTSTSLNGIAEVLDRLEEAEIRVVGADPSVAVIKNARYVPWSLEREVEELQSLSVGLMPLEKSEWSRGKCALKAIQYMACGVPCIATPFGAVCDIIEHGHNGLFADSPEEWTEAIGRLRDESFRAKLGVAARETIVERYSLEVAAPRMLELLESAL